MNIPNLDNLIAAFDCEQCILNNSKCKDCPYGYGFWDDRGDYGMWWCNEEKKLDDAYFYLKLYKHLIEDKSNDTM